MHGLAALIEPQPIMPEAIIRDWYALLTQSGKERACCIWLRRRQFDPYWPRYKGMTKLNRHRQQMRWRSVFPGYIFLPIPIFSDPNWPLVKKTPGVRQVMTNGNGDIVKIPEFGREGIEQIREIETALNASPIAAAQGIPFKVGQTVFVQKLEIEAKIVRIESRGKIEIEGPMFGGMRRMIVPVQEIEAV